MTSSDLLENLFEILRLFAVGVAAEHAVIRFGRHIPHAEGLAVDLNGERMILVDLGNRPDTVGAQELVLIEYVTGPSNPVRLVGAWLSCCYGIADGCSHNSAQNRSKMEVASKNCSMAGV